MNVIILFLVICALLEAFNRLSSCFGYSNAVESLLGSVTLFWAWIVGVTWVLSMFHMLTPEALGVAVIVTVVIIFSIRRAPDTSLFIKMCDLFSNCWRFTSEHIIFALLLTLPVIWFGWAFFRILVLPPLNYDSMTYHLPMIANWLQHGSLKIYETTTLRQVTYPVNGEILQMLHVIFIKNDSIVELVQLESLGVCFFGIYYISRSMEMSKGWSLSASCFFLTVPLILLESYTTQNDLIVAAGMVLSLVWMVSYINKPHSKSLVLLCISMGLMLGVKFHMMISFAVIFFVAMFVFWNKRKDRNSRSHLFVFLLLAAICGALLGGEIYLRNYLTTGSLLPPELFGGVSKTHVVLSFTTLAENLLSYARWWFLTGWDYVSETTWKHDTSHYGFLFGYLVLPISVLFGGALAVRQMRGEKLDNSRVIPMVIFIVMAGTFFGFSLTHTPRPYDLRYYLFIPLLLSTIPMWTLSRLRKSLEQRVAFLIIIVGLPTILMAALNDDGLTLRHALTLEPRMRTSIMLGNYAFPMTLRAFDKVAKSDESVIFCGTEDDWSYPLFGHNYSRSVYYASSLNRVLSCLDSLPVKWIVVRKEYPEIIDYLTKNTTSFDKVKVEDEKKGRQFFLFHVVGDNRSAVWYGGIFNDHWTAKSFSLSAIAPGTFTISCTVPDLYKDTVSLNYGMNDLTMQRILWASPGTYTIEIPLEKPGTVYLTPSRFFKPTAEGIDQDNRDLGIIIHTITFTKSDRTQTVAVYP